MSVSQELLCSFELLKPLDTSALKSHIKKAKNKRQTMLNSPVSMTFENMLIFDLHDSSRHSTFHSPCLKRVHRCLERTSLLRDDCDDPAF